MVHYVFGVLISKRVRECAAVAASWIESEAIYLDAETTRSTMMRIIEICLISQAGDVDELWFGQRKRSRMMRSIHGITNKAVAGAPWRLCMVNFID